MANIKLKDYSGNDVVYQGVEKISVPLADGSGMQEYSAGGSLQTATLVTDVYDSCGIDIVYADGKYGGRNLYTDFGEWSTDSSYKVGSKTIVVPQVVAAWYGSHGHFTGNVTLLAGQGSGQWSHYLVTGDCDFDSGGLR